MPTPEWTRRNAETAVRGLVATLRLARYPTPKEFSDAGQSGLFQAITTRFGGHKAFARQLGFTSPRNGWTRETVDLAIRSLASAIGCRNRYPTKREMRRHRPPGLSDAARRVGGNRARAARLGLRMTRASRNPDTAAAAVLNIVDQLSLDRYPTRKQFCEVGMSGLYCAVAERLGGHGAMATRLALPLAARAQDAFARIHGQELRELQLIR